jgi:predicted nucleic acid-binding Zn ribbon protein
MRRLGPRRLDAALGPTLARLRPATTLARVQEAWPAAVGPVLAAQTEPVSARGGTVTVRCSSAVWAQELSLLSADLLGRLELELVSAEGGSVVTALRFVVGATGRAS